MWNISKTNPKDIKKLAQLLANLNSDSKHHIGYCGDDENEIYHTLVHDFSDFDLSSSFLIAHLDNEIIGALGFDIDKDNKFAEVWGPFVKFEQMFETIANQLWSALTLLNQKNVQNYSFFINKENTLAKQFVLDMNGIENGKYLILNANATNIAPAEYPEIFYYDSSYYDSFVKLHEQSFPSTYYSAGEVLSRINDYNYLWICKDNDKEIKGYVYVEADPEHREGTIEYISVSPEYRKQGVGTKLVSTALYHLFFKDLIRDITLCVRAENEKAVHLYKASGFQVKHELTYFKKESHPYHAGGVSGE
ncbi:N-acetyltransferase [Psychrobacillus sp. FJAT-51614]|uniref:N-acetyltransferase n=1 Tax=Psychrobacillus mangrovi TaxID=3117745 RepID=A0ABU8EZI0_9BACI